MTTRPKILTEDLLICLSEEGKGSLPPIQSINRFAGQTARTCPGIIDRGVLASGSEIQIESFERHAVPGPKSVTHAYAVSVARLGSNDETTFHVHLVFLPDNL